MAKDEAKWAYWTKQIKEWQASGLSRNAYCKREGLKPTTFDYWRPLIVCKRVARPRSLTTLRGVWGRYVAATANRFHCSSRSVVFPACRVTTQQDPGH